VQTKVISADSVIPYARNPRKNSAAVDKVAASIKEFGWRQPIVVDKENVIIAGHTRLLAAQKLGMDKVPVHVADLTDAQAKAYRLADNRIAEDADWDIDLLGLEIRELDDLGFELDLTGFDNTELSALMGKVDELESMPMLADGDKGCLQQITFTLHDDQAETVKEALAEAKKMGPFVDTGNENSNGNAIAHIASAFLGAAV
jgi:ParB-like chromosome segregation protein Spo0J